MSISNKIDLVVSFDTTGSMYPVLSQVRREVSQFVKDMFSEFTDLRLGIIAHGDYCDAGKPYTIIHRELSRNEKEICKFVEEVKPTYGGDADECYELVLNLAGNTDAIGWREDAEKILIMIGDAAPHSPSYSMNKDNLDWKVEADNLRKLGIKVFSVHALAYYRSSSRAFYKAVADATMGIYLTLDQFNEIVDLIKATVYQQGGEEKLNEYITIVKDNGRLTKSMDRNFRRLKGEIVEDEAPSYSRGYGSSRKKIKTSTKSTRGTGEIKEMAELEPVLPGRFQVMTVDTDCDIKGFVTKNGIEFEKGRGFYELTKVETVQQYKEVIMQDRTTGEMFVGSQVREKLGLQPQTESGGVNEKLYAKDAKEFRLFVQSTSVNRKLIGGTTFLYEVKDIDTDDGTVIVETTETVEKKDEKKTMKKSTTTKGATKETKKATTKATTKKAEAPVVEKETKKATTKKAEAPVVEKETKKATTKKATTKKATTKKATTKKATTKKAEAPVAEKKATTKKAEAPVAEKKATTKKAEAPVTKVVNTKLDSDVFKGSFYEIEKSASKIGDKTVNKPIAVDKKKNTYDRKKVEEQFSKVTDGFNRCEVSLNKKNTTYLANNLKKLIDKANEVLNTL